MPRAFVAVSTNADTIIRMLEAQNVEAIPLTGDSVIDNIRSLETCNIVIVDAQTPSWVMREVKEHNKLAVAVETAPEGPVTAMVDTKEKFEDIVALLRPFSKVMVPITEDYVRRLATVMAMFPVVRRPCIQ